MSKNLFHRHPQPTPGTWTTTTDPFVCALARAFLACFTTLAVMVRVAFTPVPCDWE